MSTATILWIVGAVVLIAIIMTLVVRTSQRRAQASQKMGLPDLGAMSTDSLDKVHSGTAADRQPER